MADVAVLIFCDDASHPAKHERVLVAEFRKDGMLWLPRPPRSRKRPGSQWWIEDGATFHVEPGAGEGALLHHTLTCHYCPDRPLTVRVGKIDAHLDAAEHVGRALVTMSELRAMMETAGKFLPRPGTG
jgi:hypothetical protein